MLEGQAVSIGEVHVKTYVIGVLLAGLLSIVHADKVKTKDGQSYQGTVQYSDADIVKFRTADSGEVKVFYVKDVEEVIVDSCPSRPVPPEETPSPYRQSPENWEQQGYKDGSRTTGMKSVLAGAGGCIGVPVGGYVGVMAGSASDPYGSSAVGCCLLGAAAGGALGSLGGSALGAIGQSEVVNPTLDSVCKDAYRRGFQRGVRHSNNVAMGVGVGAGVLSVAGCVCLLLCMASSMNW
jgi:hypothetical protein